jgi:hypothetical protein
MPTWRGAAQSDSVKADLILLIGLADSSPTVGELELAVVSNGLEARQKLILLHTDGRNCPAGLTTRWLQVGLVWISSRSKANLCLGAALDWRGYFSHFYAQG